MLMSEKQTVPLNLFQFVTDSDLKSRNSEFNYYVFEIDYARSFIIENFPKFSDSLDNADENYIKGLWKLCCLYLHGGIFLDNDYRCADDFKLVELTDKEYFLITGPMRLSVSILSVFPNNRSIRRAINTYSGQSVIFKQGVVKPTLRINKDNGAIILRDKVIMILGDEKSEVCENKSLCLTDISYDNSGKIPLNLFQTWHTKDLPPAMKQCVELLKSQNPEFTHYLFDDNDCREFIAENFDYCVVDAFDRLIPGAYKADLWRYCVLYIRGGVYLDIKYQFSDGFKLIELTDKEYFVRDRPGYIVEKKDGCGIYNAFMVCYPGNKILLKCIYEIVGRVKYNYYGRCCLYPTGPGLLSNFFSDNEMDSIGLNFDVIVGIDTILYGKTRILLQSYPNYRSEQTCFSSVKHYSVLYKERTIYKPMRFPMKIHLTCKDKNNITNKIWVKCLDKYRIMYGSDYEIIVHDNNDIYNIVGAYFPQHLDKIKQIKVGAVLADIFRYLILYLEGGIYSDMDCEPLIKIDKLLCEKMIGPDIKTILCYEFHEQWHSGLEILTSDDWTYKNVGVCQWFIITSPNQDLFLKCYKNCMDNIDKLITICPKSDNYHKDVISLSGPLGFTKEVLDNLNNDIYILPSEYFCSGSGDGKVPFTDNSYVKHHFTYSWKSLL